MIDAVQFYRQGYNCSEAILKAINEEKKLNIPIEIASPFGTGMTIGSTCGAITGALMAVGALYGRTRAEEKNESRKTARALMNNIKDKYGSVDCKELKQRGVSCNEIIEYTYSILRENID